MFRFAEPSWLWALVLVPVLALLVWMAGRSRRKALERFADSALVERLTESVDLVARRWKAALRLLALGLLAFALARPQFGTRVETVRSVGQDIVVALDLSRSMLAEDVAPSRLERARLAVLRLMRQLDGDRIGLVGFAADAFVQSPLTTDYGAAAMFLEAMEPDLMPVQGTDLGAALRVSLEALEEGGREAGVLVVVTDGENHEAGFAEALERVVEEGIQVYLVGVGTTEGVPIPVYGPDGTREGFFRDEQGNVVTTRLAEEVFQRIVEETGGVYVRAGIGGTAFDELVDEIAEGTGEELDAMEITQFEERYQVFVAVALLLLIADVLISDRRRTEERWTGRFE
ncbi:MAG: VWA domain-containing protein [Longimicrobiales bacterium]|nr:VWA domain-containing protein [Longimicrobiales bacterium]